MVERITKRMTEDAVQAVQDGDCEIIEFYIQEWVGLDHKTLREVIDIYNSYDWEGE
jgi:hypothetical protein